MNFRQSINVFNIPATRDAKLSDQESCCLNPFSVNFYFTKTTRDHYVQQCSTRIHSTNWFSQFIGIDNGEIIKGSTLSQFAFAFFTFATRFVCTALKFDGVAYSDSNLFNRVKYYHNVKYIPNVRLLRCILWGCM